MMQLSITVRCMYEDQLVKVRVLGRFHGFYTVMLTVRAVMTFRSSKVVEMKGMIITLSEKKIWMKNIIFSWRNLGFSDPISDFPGFCGFSKDSLVNPLNPGKSEIGSQNPRFLHEKIIFFIQIFFF